MFRDQLKYIVRCTFFRYKIDLCCFYLNIFMHSKGRMKRIFTFFFITNPEKGRTNVEWASQLTGNQTPYLPQL